METLYDILGVSKDAKPEQIKKAHRALARIHHPDRRGDPEKMKEVQAAYDVLSDEDRRQRYDQTGQTDNPQGRELTVVMHVLSHAFQAVISHLIETDVDPSRVDMVGLVTKCIKDTNKELVGRRKAIEKAKHELEKCQGRFITDKENLLESMLKNHIEMCSTEIEEITGKIKGGEKAAEFLKDYRYKFDLSSFGIIRTTSSTSTWTTTLGP